MLARRLTHRTWIALFFTALVALGLLTVGDYGMGWDEPFQQSLGEEAYRYVVHGDRKLLSSRHQYYGTAVELPLRALEHLLVLPDVRYAYLVRHLVTYLLFVLGAWWLYRLGSMLFDDPRWGLAAAALLVASPRIFADAFLNSKDVPFMVFFTGAMLTLVSLLRRPGWGPALRHALLCALAIDTRVVGLLLVPITLGFGALAVASAPPPERRLRATHWAGSLAAMAPAVVLFWPMLWTSPARHLLDAIAEASRYPWDGLVLYRGALIKPGELPWHYIPSWIAMTTPFVYLLLAAVGAGVGIQALMIKGAAGRAPERLVPYVWLLGPWCVVVARDAALYDAWRHLFFIYPALVLLAVAGARALLAIDGRARAAVAAVLVLAIGDVVLAMVRSHPHQNVYFSGWVAPASVRDRFDLDYWGTSYREGLEYVLRNDRREQIHVWVANVPGIYNSLMLPRAERDRLAFMRTPDQADYLLTNFRKHPKAHPEFDPATELAAVTVRNVKILGIYRGPGAAAP